MRRPVVLLAVSLSIGAVGCDDRDPRLSARVESQVGGKVCFLPEDNRWSDYRACYTTVGADMERLQPGTCVNARFPSALAPETLTTPVTVLSILERTCG